MFKADIIKKYSKINITPSFLIVLIAVLFVSLIYHQAKILVSGMIELKGYGILTFNLGLGMLASIRKSLIMNESWTWITPVMMVLSVIFVLLSIPIIGIYLSVAASILMYLLTIRQLQLEITLGGLIQVLGAASFVIGNVLFEQGHPIDEVIVWWIGFPILLICGDKLLKKDDGIKGGLPFLASLSFMWLSGALLIFILGASGWIIVFYILFVQAVWLLKEEFQLRAEICYTHLFSRGSYFWLAISSLFALYFSYPENFFEAPFLFELSFSGFVLNSVFVIWSKLIHTSKNQEMRINSYQFLTFFLLQASLIASISGNFFDIPLLHISGIHGIGLSLIILLGVSLIRVIRIFKNQNLLNRQAF